MDYVLEKKEESCYGSMGQFGNISTTPIMIFDSVESAEIEVAKEQYKFVGNSTGSVSYSIRERKEDDVLNKRTTISKR